MPRRARSTRARSRACAGRSPRLPRPRRQRLRRRRTTTTRRLISGDRPRQRRDRAAGPRPARRTRSRPGRIVVGDGGLQVELDLADAASAEPRGARARPAARRRRLAAELDAAVLPVSAGEPPTCRSSCGCSAPRRAGRIDLMPSRRRSRAAPSTCRRSTTSPSRRRRRCARDLGLGRVVAALALGSSPGVGVSDARPLPPRGARRARIELAPRSTRRPRALAADRGRCSGARRSRRIPAPRSRRSPRTRWPAFLDRTGGDFAAVVGRALAAPLRAAPSPAPPRSRRCRRWIAGHHA